MTERERLDELSKLTPLEILNDFRNRYYNDGNNTESGIVANAINDILPHMILPPCKVGDTVYRIFPRISDAIPPWVGDTPETVGCIGIATKNLLGNWNVYPIEEIGKTVFLTREEAEAALEERSKG